jgi:hypothetical protein
MKHLIIDRWLFLKRKEGLWWDVRIIYKGGMLKCQNMMN